jgi:hypothetical protein
MGHYTWYLVPCDEFSQPSTDTTAEPERPQTALHLLVMDSLSDRALPKKQLLAVPRGTQAHYTTKSWGRKQRWHAPTALLTNQPKARRSPCKRSPKELFTKDDKATRQGEIDEAQVFSANKTCAIWRKTWHAMFQATGRIHIAWNSFATQAGEGGTVTLRCITVFIVAQ